MAAAIVALILQKVLTKSYTFCPEKLWSVILNAVKNLPRFIQKLGSIRFFAVLRMTTLLRMTTPPWMARCRDGEKGPSRKYITISYTP